MDVETQQGDLVVEAGEGVGLESGQVGLVKVGGVEAVLDGVEVAGLDRRGGAWGMGWRAECSCLVCAQIFYECNRVNPEFTRAKNG